MERAKVSSKLVFNLLISICLLLLLLLLSDWNKEGQEEQVLAPPTMSISFLYQMNVLANLLHFDGECLKVLLKHWFNFFYLLLSNSPSWRLFAL